VLIREIKPKTYSVIYKEESSYNIYFYTILLSGFLFLGCAQKHETSVMRAKESGFDHQKIIRDKKIPIKIGYASYYANSLDGRPTACGERYCKNKLTAAHKTLPFGTMVRVTRVSTGRQVIVVINDRGPYVKGRLIDLSFEAAKELDMIRAGVSKVKIEVVSLVK
jgi:rare lipoprotein A